MSKEDGKVLRELESVSCPNSEPATIGKIRALYNDVLSITNTIESECIVQGDVDPKPTYSVTKEEASSAKPMHLSNHVEDEIAILKQRLEILELRSKIAVLENEKQASKINQPLLPEALKQIIPQFEDGVGVNHWLKVIDHSSEMYGWDDNTTMLYASSRLVGAAKEWYNGCRSEICTLSEFTAGLKRAFPDNRNEAAIHKELMSVAKRRDETYTAFIYRVNAIGKSGNVSDEAILTYIINGLARDRIYDNLVVRDYKDIYELMAHIQRCETLLKMRDTPSTSSYQRLENTRVNENQREKPNRAAQINRKDALASVRCYNCSSFGHYSGQCLKPRRTIGACFSCGQHDHQKLECANAAGKNNIPVFATNETTSERDSYADIEKIKAYQQVSVSLETLNGVKKFHSYVYSLFDSGSPTSFISETFVPDGAAKKASPSGYKGLGNKPLSSLGHIVCNIGFRHKIISHRFIILSKSDMDWPIINGRDALDKLNVHLYHSFYLYSKEKLLSLNNKTMNYLEPHMMERLISLGVLKNDSDDRLKRKMPLIKAIEENKYNPKEIPFHSLNHAILESSLSNRKKDDNSNQSFISDEFKYGETFAEMCAIDVNLPEHDFNIGSIVGIRERKQISSIIIDNYIKRQTGKIYKENHKMTISLTHDTPIFCKPRKLSFAERNHVREIVKDLLQRKIIRQSNSAYASPIVLVKKKNGETRMCIDYRPINKITVRDNYPLPLIDTCIEHLGDKQYFTLLDLKNGFHQIDMAPESIKYTAFVTPDGQYEYVKMPFGLKNAPSEFQRCINSVLREFIDNREIVVYLDDIIIASKDLHNHLRILSAVLQTIRKNGLELKLEKCMFVHDELDYLGYHVSSKGIRPSNYHIKAIENYPQPSNSKEVQRCLGLFSYFRRFVPSFSTIAKPLSSLLKQNAPYNFDGPCISAFNTLKEMLIKAPVLAIYDPQKETELHCDASSVGFGSVLLQKQFDGKFHPIAFFSKTASPAEAKLHSYELETLSVIYALKRFHTYVHGVPIRIVTDCNSLVETLKNKNCSAKIARWSLFLENYDYTMQYRPGCSMGHVDALSRQQIAVATQDLDIDSQLRIAQSRDQEIERLKSVIERGMVNGYTLHDNLVFRKLENGRLQFRVPRDMINNVIRSTHESIGHLGVDKCCTQISKNYWFPLMKTRVENFIKNCLKCIIYSAPARKNNRNLHSIPKIPLPFDTIHIDHLGPLPSLQSKKKYILVVIDAFTKFTKLYPTTNTSSREVCNALNQYFSYFSRPRRLISDRASSFTSTEFKQFILKHNITHVLTAVCSPQANGQVERVNRVIVPILSKLSDPIDHADRSSKLIAAEYALNNTVHSSTRISPSVLLYGIEQKGPNINELTEYLKDNIPTTPRDLESIRVQASENIVNSQFTNETQFMKTHRPAIEFEVGEYVVIRNVDNSVNTNKKLIAKFRGPYVIHKRLPNDRYVVRDIEGFQQTQIPYDGVLI